jgi:hypothetical protein
MGRHGRVWSLPRLSVLHLLTLDPFVRDRIWDDHLMALVHAGKYGGALIAVEKIATPAPWSGAHAAIAQVNLGDLGSANTPVARYRGAGPGLPDEDWIRLGPFLNMEIHDRRVADLGKVLSSI